MKQYVTGWFLDFYLEQEGKEFPFISFTEKDIKFETPKAYALKKKEWKRKIVFVPKSQCTLQYSYNSPNYYKGWEYDDGCWNDYMDVDWWVPEY